MDRCNYCGKPIEQNGHGRPREYCSNTCANSASVVRRVPVETIRRLRPDIRKLLANAER